MTPPQKKYSYFSEAPASVCKGAEGGNSRAAKTEKCVPTEDRGDEKSYVYAGLHPLRDVALLLYNQTHPSVAFGFLSLSAEAPASERLKIISS